MSEHVLEMENRFLFLVTNKIETYDFDWSQLPLGRTRLAHGFVRRSPLACRELLGPPSEKDHVLCPSRNFSVPVGISNVLAVRYNWAV